MLQRSSFFRNHPIVSFKEGSCNCNCGLSFVSISLSLTSALNFIDGLMNCLEICMNVCFLTSVKSNPVHASLWQSNHFHNKLSEILDTVATPDTVDASSSESQSQSQSVPVFEMQFPDLFVYWRHPCTGFPHWASPTHRWWTGLSRARRTKARTV